MSQEPRVRPVPDHERLVTAWIRHYERVVQGREKANDEDFWAHEAMREFCDIDPDLAWEVLGMIVERVKEPALLACLAAGPLEDLIVNHGRDIIDKIERYAAASARFRETLVGVWRRDIPQDVWARIE